MLTKWKVFSGKYRIGIPGDVHKGRFYTGIRNTCPTLKASLVSPFKLIRIDTVVP